MMMNLMYTCTKNYHRMKRHSVVDHASTYAHSPARTPEIAVEPGFETMQYVYIYMYVYTYMYMYNLDVNDKYVYTHMYNLDVNGNIPWKGML
jgi:hypothetical protein